MSRRFCTRLLVFLVIRTNRIPTQMSVCAYQNRMTITLLVQIFRAKKKSTDPRSSRGGAEARAFFYISYNQEMLVNGQDILHDAHISA